MNSLVTKLFLGLVCIGTLVGCNQNPYENVLQPGQNSSDKPDTGSTAPKVFSIEAPDVIECVEGTECFADIIGHVPSPGVAQISFKGLPSGAVYDAAKQMLTFTAPFEFVDVGAKPEMTMVNVPVEVTVRSTADAVAQTTRAITMIVKNKMRPVTINLTGSNTTSEGSTLEQVVTVVSPDFPQGPFSLAAINAPVGTEIKQVSGNPNQFAVRFTPNYLFVSNTSTRSVNISYNVSLPVGAAASQNATWSITDIRQNAAITVPENITQGLEVNFSIRAEDLNGEVAPAINVSPTVPFGRLSTVTVLETTASGGNIPSKVVQVKWDQLKLENLGTTTAIKYDVCVKKASGSTMSICTTKATNVTLKADLHPAPKMDRNEWKSGDLKFFRAGVPMTFKMPVMDSEDPKFPVVVNVVSSQAGAVTWKNGILTVNPQSEGVLQITVTAQSVWGQTLTENFLSEVFPTSWAKNILMTSDTVQTESTDWVKMLPSTDLLSAKFQVSSRTLALRDSCVITTEALSIAKIDEATQNKLYANVGNILISTPLAGSVDGKIADELKNFGVKVLGRYSALTRGDLSSATLNVDSKSNLETPKVPAGLKGTLTKESDDPLLFNVDRMSSKCVVLFNLQKPAFSEAAGVSCKAADGKILTVLGFELGDVLTNPRDAGIVDKWINAILTGKAI